MHIISYFILFWQLCSITFNISATITIETIFGTDTINEPIIEELIASNAFQRLKKINQYGCNRYTFTNYDYTRYSHSLGVYILLKKYNASLKEQIAGLLHDISHTVFSHVGDHLYRNNSYQDDIHSWYIRSSDIEAILKKYNYTVDDINPKNGQFHLLEQSLPDLCADRIEYTINGGFLEGKLTKEEITDLMQHLLYKDGAWYFDDQNCAKKLADISLFLTQNVFGSPDNMVCYDWCATALQRALAISELTFNDIHFSNDDCVWNILLKSNDAIIKEYMKYLQDYKKYFKINSVQKTGMHFFPKMRGHNPWVQTDKGMVRLTDLDIDYKKRYEELKNILEVGYYIDYI